MDYNAYITALATLLAYQTQTIASVVSSTDTSFNTIFPQLIDYAEQRIYRELDVLPTRKVVASGTFTASNRIITAPADAIVINGLNVITPYGAASADAGKRNPLRRVNLDFLEAIWPQAASRTDVPQYYADLDNTSFIVAPTPDQAYRAEWRYLFRPTALSAATTTTYLSTTYPDLLVAAGMVFGSGYIRNFGSQADDPKMALSWELQYQTLLASAKAEVARSRGEVDRDLAPTSPPANTPQA